MAVTLPPLPTIPPQPDATAAWDRWDIYLRCVSLNLEAMRIQNAAAQAAAQSETAKALERNAAAHEAQNEFLREKGFAPVTLPRPSDEQLFMHYAGQRENAPFADIPSKVRDFATSMVKEHRTKYPA